LDLFKIVNTLGNFILQTNFEEGEQEMIEAELINLVLGTELDVAAFHASQYCLCAEIKTLTFALRHCTNSDNLRRASFSAYESSTVQPKECSIVR